MPAVRHQKTTLRAFSATHRGCTSPSRGNYRIDPTETSQRPRRGWRGAVSVDLSVSRSSSSTLPPGRVLIQATVEEHNLPGKAGSPSLVGVR